MSFHIFYTLQHTRSEDYSVAVLNSDAGLHGVIRLNIREYTYILEANAMELK